jgi:hypothetical protein
MTKKQLLRLAALAQGAAVISVAGCNQTPTVTAPTGDAPVSAPLNGPMSINSATDSTTAADASAPDATATAFRPHPPYLNAPPRPLPTGSGPQP